jgi:3',5'-cyclic AMP phosphodiesterase CpdA
MVVVRRALALMGVLACACLKTTPYGADPEEEDLNRKNRDALLRRPAPERLTFVAIADTHDAYDDLAEAAERVNGDPDVSLIVHAGDMSNQGLLQEFEWSRRALAHFAAPLLMTIGNHDALSAGKEIYWRMYGSYDYSFVWADLKWVFFNSNTLEFGRATPDRAWLLREVSDRQGARGVVVVTHQSPTMVNDFPGGDLRQFLRDLLETGDVTLFIHGHLDGFRFYRVGATPVIQCSTFQKHGTYAKITLDGAAVDVARCRYEACRRVEPEPAQ